MATTDRNRERIAQILPPDTANRVEVDCPECRAPGRATEYYTPDASRTLVAVECDICGMFHDLSATTATATSDGDASPDLEAVAREYLSARHAGAGWYELSDGTKVRTKDKATAAQVHLLREDDTLVEALTSSATS